MVAGANPGAFIDFVDLAHGEGAEQEVIIGTGESISLSHSGDDEDDDGEGTESKDKPDGKKKEEPEGDNETVEEVFNTLTDKQKKSGVWSYRTGLGRGRFPTMTTTPKTSPTARRPKTL